MRERKRAFVMLLMIVSYTSNAKGPPPQLTVLVRATIHNNLYFILIFQDNGLTWLRSSPFTVCSATTSAIRTSHPTWSSSSPGYPSGSAWTPYPQGWPWAWLLSSPSSPSSRVPGPTCPRCPTPLLWTCGWPSVWCSCLDLSCSMDSSTFSTDRRRKLTVNLQRRLPQKPSMKPLKQNQDLNAR